MDSIQYSQALDMSFATLQDIRRKKPPLTYAYSTYQFWNYFVRNGIQTVGDELEGHITLGSEGNARHTGFWDADTTVKKNISQRYKLNWRHAESSMAWNLIEMSINAKPARIYKVWDQQYKACIRDMVDEMFVAMLTGPSSANDTHSPYSVFSWLPLGTDGSTGGWTGYSGNYNDGSTPGTEFDRGGLSCSASVNSDFAGWFADHGGNLDDSLLTIMNDFHMTMNFQPPIVPEKLPVDKVNCAYYTTKNVIKKLNSFYAMSDDNMGYNRNSHYGTPSFYGVPLVWAGPLDTANTSVYGTDPIVGIHHNLLYPVILRDWNFRIDKRPDKDRHTVMTLYVDCVYQIWCENPRHAGGLITQYPS